MNIKNKKGNKCVEISSDKEGEGSIKVNSEKGEKRYELSLDGDRAQSSYYNTKGNSVLLLGVYRNADVAFTRFRDSEGKKKPLRIE